MQDENDSYDLDKYYQDGEDLSGVCHVKKNAKNIERQQGEDNGTDHADNDLLKIACGIF